jgi:phosphohistidine phosphatase
MMDLILWRHAEAEDSFPDHARELTKKGVRQAEKVAAFLKGQLPEHTRVLVSPATRTQQTASALTHHFTTTPSIAPGATPQAILEAAQWPRGNGTVLIVGHQPTLGEVAAHLLGCADNSLNIKKGAVWWFSQSGGYGLTTLRLVITPDLL